MGCSGHYTCTDIKQRAERMPIMVPAGEEDGTDLQGAASALSGTRGQGFLPFFLPELETPARLTSPSSS